MVLESKRIELFSGQVEVKHGEDGLELLLGNSALSQLIEINKEFFDSDALHHN